MIDSLRLLLRNVTDRYPRNTLAVAVCVLLALIAMVGRAWWTVPLLALVGILVWVWAAERDVRPRAPKVAAAPNAQAMLGRALEALDDPALLLDGQERVVQLNAAARALFPSAAGSFVSRVIRAPELNEAIDGAIKTRESRNTDVRLLIPVDRMLAVRVQPIDLDVADAPPHLLVIMRDTGEEQRLAEMRAQFVANASHELRTPLASLKGFIETLQGPAKDDTAAHEKFLGVMQQQADRMSRLIDDLLSLSRIEMRAHLPPIGLVDLAALVTDIERAMQPLAAKAEQRLTLAIGEQPAFVSGDKEELAQAIQNLVQNACKYGTRGGHVLLSLKRKGDRWMLAVDDDGIGIAPEHLPRLTERFYRVSTHQSRERGGTGLGLAIVKHIMNRHGGDLTIESRPGRGSTFTLWLPRHAATDSSGRPAGSVTAAELAADTRVQSR